MSISIHVIAGFSLLFGCRTWEPYSEARHLAESGSCEEALQEANHSWAASLLENGKQKIRTSAREIEMKPKAIQAYDLPVFLIENDFCSGSGISPIEPIA